MPKRSSLGFTLVELLVVISIVGVLSALGLGAFTSSQSRARDAKRQADTKAIMKAVEQMYAKDGLYPTYNGGCSDFAGLTEYFPQGIPIDPKTNQQYGCWTGLSLSNYCVESVYFENSERANCMSGCLTCPAGGCPEDNFHYCNWSQFE